MDAPENGWTLGAYRAHMDKVLSDLRDLMQKQIDERDRQYNSRFESAEKQVTVAFAAQKELASFVRESSEKAILKSEEAQRSYNERSNEFRGQLDDQAKTLMPRSEVDAKIKALEVLFYQARDSAEDERNRWDARISKLDTSQANLQGRMWAIPIMISGVMWVIGLAVMIALRFMR